ncbi:ribosome biogenesis GTPase Der [Mycoplasma sp. ATU-Cv-508]|uniref:ribosome biogenesis GTPase Der n=1 Tax=Mycoplasma sp. ATU-Cv-508 TaxID=2048001 RepID=UPI000FDD7532
MNNLVAIVGRPNVGKSTLFNRLTKTRQAITSSSPGTTRDRNFARLTKDGISLTLVDTGGLEVSSKSDKIAEQTEFAIAQANVILFVVDGRSILVPDDLRVAKMLRKTNRPVLVLANKMEQKNPLDKSLWSLGYPIVEIAALHAIGIQDLWDWLLPRLEKGLLSESSQEPKLVILGQTNVGKSSLLNALSGQKRAIVSSQKHTTRDAVSEKINLAGQEFEIIDTAGLRRKSRLEEDVDYFAYLRTQRALESATIVVLVLDATQKPSHFDARIIGYVEEEKKPFLIVVNKWDLVGSQISCPKFQSELVSKWPFLKWVPVVCVSALRKEKIDQIGQALSKVLSGLKTKITTRNFNDLLNDVQTVKPAPSYRGSRLEIFFGQQVQARIPTFKLFVNNKQLAHFSYLRFIENQIRQVYPFWGVPIRFLLENKRQSKA